MKLPDHQVIACLLLISALPLQAQNSAENMPPANIGTDIYLGGEAGPLYMQDMQVHVGTKEKFKFDLGTRFDLVLGYKFSQSWSTELDCGVIWNAIDKYGAGSFSGTKADIYQFPVMVNYLYWLPIKGPLEGFLGGGAGLVVGHFHISQPGQDFRDTDATFGYQALAGLNYHLCSQVDLTLAYKFLGTTSHKWIDDRVYTQTQGSLTHAVLLGVSVKY